MECLRAQWSDLVWINLNLQLFPECATPVLPELQAQFSAISFDCHFHECWKLKAAKSEKKFETELGFHASSAHRVLSLALYFTSFASEVWEMKARKMDLLVETYLLHASTRESITCVLCAIMQRTKRLNNFRVTAWWRESGWTTTFLEPTTSDNGEYNKYLTRKVRLQLSAAFSIIARSFPYLLRQQRPKIAKQFFFPFREDLINYHHRSSHLSLSQLFLCYTYFFPPLLSYSHSGFSFNFSAR